MNVVPRSRLATRFRDSLARGIAILVAPAGYGKSTLIATTVGQGQPALGLGLEMSVEAWSKRLVARYAPPSTGAFADWYAAHRDGAGAAAVVAELLADAGRPVVLDDLHAVPAGSEIWPFLQSLIEQTTPSTQWVLSSREMPPLPIARWVAAGLAILPIAGNDFRFTPDEVRELAVLFGEALTDEHVQRAFEATGGWSIALSLWLATQGWTMDRAAFARSRAELTSYLATEIWGNLDDDDRWILACQAVADTSDTAAIETAAPQGVRRLHRLSHRIPLFLTGDDAQVPRLHALLREFILDRIVETDSYFGAVIDSVAQAFERTGAVTASVNTALLRGWTALGERLLIAYGCDTVFKREGHGICSFLHGAPAVTSRQQQIRECLLAIESSLDGDMEPMRRHVEAWADSPDAIERLQFPLTTSLRRYYVSCNEPSKALSLPYDLSRLDTTAHLLDATRVAAALVISGDVDRGRQLLSLIESRADRADPHDRDELFVGLAFIYHHLGNLGTAEAERLCNSILVATESDAMKARVLSILAALSSGNEALELSLKMLACSKASNDLHLISHALAMVNVYAAYCNEITSAPELAAQLDGLPRFLIRPDIDSSLFVRTIAAARRGDYQRARETIAQIGSSDSVAYHFLLWKGLLALANGDIATARRAARDRILPNRVADYFTRSEFAHAKLEQALLRWILGDEIVASIVPNWLHKKHHATYEPLVRTMRLPRRTATFEQVSSAFDPMKHTGAIALAEAYTNVITAGMITVDEHEGLPTAETLTPAQEQVLEALRRGESNKAIAARSGRSINTVRTHVAVVLAKLGYKTRAELAANYRP